MSATAIQRLAACPLNAKKRSLPNSDQDKNGKNTKSSRLWVSTDEDEDDDDQSMISENSHSLALYRLYNCNEPTLEWCALHFNQILTSRQTKF